MNKINIESYINNFLSREKLEDKVILTVVRNDGISLFSSIRDNHPLKDKFYHLGALVGGVWQASNELLNICHLVSKSDLRLSFDSSDTGFYILPIKLKKNNFFLSCVFNQIVNPGKLKRLLQVLCNELTDSFAELPQSTQKLTRIEKKTENKNQDSLLFTDITDKEIDDLFKQVEI